MSATSRCILPNGTVVAGCSCATGVVKLLTLCVLREVAIKTPVCRPVNLVDDIKLHAVGGEKVVSEQRFAPPFWYWKPCSSLSCL